MSQKNQDTKRIITKCSEWPWKRDGTKRRHVESEAVIAKGSDRPKEQQEQSVLHLIKSEKYPQEGKIRQNGTWGRWKSSAGPNLLEGFSSLMASLAVSPMVSTRSSLSLIRPPFLKKRLTAGLSFKIHDCKSGNADLTSALASLVFDCCHLKTRFE